MDKILRRFILCFSTAVLLTGADWGPDYVDDLILKGRSDSTIKFLTPPLSLSVIHNRPAKGSNYFFIGEEKQFDASNGFDGLDPYLNDLKTIKRTLVKADPARLVPAKQGTDVRGPVTRNALRDLAKKQLADLLLVFRWEVHVNAEGIKTFGGGETSRPIGLTARGLVYISKQNKILALLANTQTGMNLPELTYAGLKALAGEARKIIQAQKKIVSDSY